MDLFLDAWPLHNFLPIISLSSQRPVRQAKRKCTLELRKRCAALLRNAQFFKPILHPLANVVPVKKKNGQI